jgi:hypothetical protein
MTIGSTRFHDEHCGRGILREAVAEHAAGRPRTNDDVVECFLGHMRATFAYDPGSFIRWYAPALKAMRKNRTLRRYRAIISG